MKRPGVRTILSMSWRVLSTLVIVGLGIALLLFSQLETLLPAYAQVEVETAQSASSFGVILENPINAPYKLVVLASATIIGDPLLATRVTSAIFATLSILMFYYIIRRIHCPRSAFLSVLLFASSAWFLHIARIGTADIMLPFAVLSLAVAGYWLMRDSSRSIFSVAAILALVISIYVPGMLWFAFAALAIRRKKDISVVIEDVPKRQLIGLVIMILLFVIAPLTWAIAQQPTLALTILGLPKTMPEPMAFFENLAAVPLTLFAYSAKDPVMWLGNLPLLDIASSALFFLGLYYYFKVRKLDRAKLLGIFLAWASILIALEGGVTNAILLPAVYVAIAGGIALMITQWFTVFPKNPLARNVGVVLIALIVGTSMFYNLRSYFVAWPHWNETKAVFTQTDTDLVQ